MNRREAITAVIALAASARVVAQSRVSTLIGTGTPGFSDRDVNNPYGVILGPGGLYFCDLDADLAGQHPPLVAEYLSCGLTVRQDFRVP